MDHLDKPFIVIYSKQFLGLVKMALRTISRKIKIELLQQDGDITNILFQYPQTQKACRLFLNTLKTRRSFTREELSKFSWDLLNKKIDPDFSYSRDGFYETIRKTLLTLGFITITHRPATAEHELRLEPERKNRRRDLIELYVPVLQPIKKRPPDGLNFVRLSWIICKKWNDEFFPTNAEAQKCS